MKPHNTPKQMHFCKRMNLRFLRSSKLLLPAVLFYGGSAFAATLTWDGGDHTANTSYGGAGTWDSATVNWTKAGAEVNWTDTTGVDTAVFAGTAGTVTISGTNTVNGLTFGTTGFTVTGGTLNLAGTTPSLSVIGSSANSNTISSVISDTASAGLTKTGVGILVLKGVNTYTGNTSILSGQLSVSGNIVSGSNGALGNASSAILLGDTSGSANATLNAFASATIGRAITVQAGNSGTASIALSYTGSYNSSSITGAITLGSNGTGHDLLLDVGNAATNQNVGLTISGVIQDPTGLVGKAGSVTFLGYNASGVGTSLTLSGSNTFSGGFNMGRDTSIYGANPGTYLAINNDYALGTGVFTINGGNIVTSGTLKGISGMVWKTNFGVLNSAQSGGSANFGTAPVTLANTSKRTTVSIVGWTQSGYGIVSGILTVGGVISGVGQGLDFGAPSVSNTSTLVLNGANTFDGGLTMVSKSGGATTVLNIGNLGSSTSNSALGTGTFIIGSGTAGTTLKFDNTSGADGTLATNNAQVWNNNFQFVGTKSLNMGTGAVTLSNTNATVTVTVVAKTLTIGGAIGNGVVGNAITKAGAGTLVLAGANTFTGDTTVSSGTLVLANLNALQNSTLASGAPTFDSSVSSSGNFVLGGIKGSTNIALQDNSASHNAVALSVGNNNQDTTYSGIFSGAGSLTKIGTGTLTLTNANTYTGTTTVQAGTLAVGVSGAISGKVVLGQDHGSTGTLDVSAKTGFSQADISGNGLINIGTGKTVTATGNVTPGFGIGELDIAGDFTLAGTASTLLEIGGASSFDLIHATGILTYGGGLTVIGIDGFDLDVAGTYALFTAGSFSNAADFNSVTINGITLTSQAGTWIGSDGRVSYQFSDATGVLAVETLSVPEPGTWAMLVGGMGLLAFNQRIRRRSRVA